jgi:hypothetical protein
MRVRLGTARPERTTTAYGLDLEEEAGRLRVGRAGVRGNRAGCVQAGRALWADTLGPTKSDGATYLKSLASNTRAMIDGVTGGAITCSLPS